LSEDLTESFSAALPERLLHKHFLYYPKPLVSLQAVGTLRKVPTVLIPLALIICAVFRPGRCYLRRAGQSLGQKEARMWRKGKNAIGAARGGRVCNNV